MAVGPFGISVNLVSPRLVGTIVVHAALKGMSRRHERLPSVRSVARLADAESPEFSCLRDDRELGGRKQRVDQPQRIFVVEKLSAHIEQRRAGLRTFHEPHDEQMCHLASQDLDHRHLGTQHAGREPAFHQRQISVPETQN
jgi:hypothetical protein